MDAVITTSRVSRKLTTAILEPIAEMIEKQKLTESEACHQLGIKPQQWFVFKCRQKVKPQFESICARIRGSAVLNAMNRIEKAGEDMVIDLPNGKQTIRRGDWRADHARLQLIAPERFGDRQQAVGNQTNVLIGDDVAARMIELFKQNKQRAIESSNQSTTKLVGNEQTIESIEVS
jgi:hypothetical protein